MYISPQPPPPVSVCACKEEEGESHFLHERQEQEKKKKKNLLSNSCLANRANNEIQYSFPTVVRIIFGGDARAAAPTHC